MPHFLCSQQRDIGEWCKALQGASEYTGASASSGVLSGAMLGGRGCVESLGNNEYLVTVAWQSMRWVDRIGEATVLFADLMDDWQDSKK